MAAYRHDDLDETPHGYDPAPDSLDLFAGFCLAVISAALAVVILVALYRGANRIAPHHTPHTTTSSVTR